MQRFPGRLSDLMSDILLRLPAEGGLTKNDIRESETALEPSFNVGWRCWPALLA